MVTRMVHPNHGTTFAVGSEIEWNIANGWKVEDEKAEPVGEFPGGAVDDPVEPESLRQELTLEQRYIEKFGKPPHHRMKKETVENALRK